jgi:hypothetical protein
MSISRREFMKLFGVSVASLLLARCKPVTPAPPPTDVFIGCYEPTMPPDLMTPQVSLPARERLRLGWLRFGELAGSATQDTENTLGNQMIADHRAALDELVAAGEISAPVADLVQEAYAAAVFHIWRSNAPITCYMMMPVNYAPAGADTLVRQADALEGVAAGGEVDPDTLATIRSALEHDLAFYALTDEEVDAMYERLRKESQDDGKSIPDFEELDLELTPDVKTAAQVIIDLLTGK